MLKSFGFSLLNFSISIDSPKMMGNFPEVLNFNRNQVICIQQLVLPVHRLWLRQLMKLTG